MKFGANMFIWTESFSRDNWALLPRLKAAGFDGIEVGLFDPKTFATGDVKKGLADNGLECTICSVVGKDVNIISDDATVRARARTHMEACIRLAAEIGAKIISGPLYSPVGYLPGRRRTADEWKWAMECYQSLGPVLVQHGVTIAIEPLNRFETYFLNIAADAAKLAGDIHHPNIGILFDTFHANIEEKDVAQAYRTVGPYLKHVHTCENDRGIPGSGHVDWKGVFAVLSELGYDGWLTIESFGFHLPNLSAAAAIWRDIEASPDDIAFEGIKFLKRQVAGMRRS